MRPFTCWRARSSFRSAIAQSRERPDPCSSSRALAHSFPIESEQSRMLILLTPAGLEGWFKEFSVPAPAMTLPPAEEPAYEEVQKMLEAAPRYGIEFVLP